MQPEQVHFIATSATIGDPHGQAGKDLKKFLADIAGVSDEQVHLVAGTRQIPEIGSKKRNKKPIKNLAELEDIEPEQEVSTTRYRALAGNKIARDIRTLFTNGSKGSLVARLSSVCQIIHPDKKDFTPEQQGEALRWLDLLSGTKKEGKHNKEDVSDSFLPLRGHLFHQTLSGIWACADPSCADKQGTALSDTEWHFGKVYLEPRKHCTCGSPVYEVVRCVECGTVYLLAEENQQGVLTQPQPSGVQDEFELDVELHDDDIDDVAPQEENVRQSMPSRIRFLIVNRGKNMLKQSRLIVQPGKSTILELTCSA